MFVSFFSRSFSIILSFTQENAIVSKEYPLDITKVSVFSVMFILTVFGNMAVIIAIGARKAKMTRMYYFILHLSLADLLTAFLRDQSHITSFLGNLQSSSISDISFLDLVGQEVDFRSKTKLKEKIL